MLVTQKCRYALRAVFALARRGTERPTKIAQIAEEQQIPIRFLEVILSQLKQGGFVESRRGTEGGYLLARRPDEIRVGDIVRFVDGPNYLIEPEAKSHDENLLRQPDIFMTIWLRALEAVFEIFDEMTLDDLLVRERSFRSEFIPNYMI